MNPNAAKKTTLGTSPYIPPYSSGTRILANPMWKKTTVTKNSFGFRLGVAQEKYRRTLRSKHENRDLPCQPSGSQETFFVVWIRVVGGGLGGLIRSVFKGGHFGWREWDSLYRYTYPKRVKESMDGNNLPTFTILYLEFFVDPFRSFWEIQPFFEAMRFVIPMDVA